MQSFSVICRSTPLSSWYTAAILVILSELNHRISYRSDYKLSRSSRRAPEHWGEKKCELVSECLELETRIFPFVCNFLGGKGVLFSFFLWNNLHTVCCLLTWLCPFPCIINPNLWPRLWSKCGGNNPEAEGAIHQRPVCCKLCPSERWFQGGDDFLFHCPIWMFVVGNPSGAAVYLLAVAACQVGSDKVMPTLFVACFVDRVWWLKVNLVISCETLWGKCRSQLRPW